jgi:hypothetical protein
LDISSPDFTHSFATPSTNFVREIAKYYSRGKVKSAREIASNNPMISDCAIDMGDEAK